MGSRQQPPDEFRLEGSVSVLRKWAFSKTRRYDGYWQIANGNLTLVRNFDGFVMAAYQIHQLTTLPSTANGEKFYVEGPDIYLNPSCAFLYVTKSTNMENYKALPGLMKKWKEVGPSFLSSIAPKPRLTTQGLPPLGSGPKRSSNQLPLASTSTIAGPPKRPKIERVENDRSPHVRQNKENSENKLRPKLVEHDSPMVPAKTFYGEKPVASSFFPSSTVNVPVKLHPPRRRVLENKDQISFNTPEDVSPVKPHLQGFSNLGNTCYMNAILQSLFVLDPFAKEIWKVYQPLERYVQQKQLFKSFTQLLKNRDNPQKSLKDGFLRSIKEAISVSATRFSGFSQNDAHEFLSQVLDQLKEEINLLNDGRKLLGAQRRPNPVTNNFEFSVCHAIKCSQCGNVIQKEENFTDLSLDVPSTSSLLSATDYNINLQDLLDSFFHEETVSYRCELCNASSSAITHKFTRLSRVVILHLKRYTFNTNESTNVKIANKVTVPKFLTLHHHCAPTTQPTSALTDSVKKVVLDTPGSSRFNSNVLSPNTVVRRQLNFADTSNTQPQHTSTPRATDSEQKRKSLQGYQFKERLSSVSEEAVEKTVPPFNTAELVDMTAVPNDDEDDDYQKAVNESLKDVPRILSEEEQFELETRRAIEASLVQDKDSANTDVLTAVGSHDTDTVKENVNMSTGPLKSPSTGVTPVENALERSPMENQEEGRSSPGLSPIDRTVTERTSEQNERLHRNYTHGDLPHSFRLVGIVSHIGSSTSSGHYITDVWETRKGGWVSFDDSSATLISEADVLHKRRGSGYIFFYMAKELLEPTK